MICKRDESPGSSFTVYESFPDPPANATGNVVKFCAVVVLLLTVAVAPAPTGELMIDPAGAIARTT